MATKGSIKKTILFNPSPWKGANTFKKRVTPIALSHIDPYLEQKKYDAFFFAPFVI